VRLNARLGWSANESKLSQAAMHPAVVYPALLGLQDTRRVSKIGYGCRRSRLGPSRRGSSRPTAASCLTEVLIARALWVPLPILLCQKLLGKLFKHQIQSSPPLTSQPRPGRQG
jgi:hypothetical protein